MGKYVPWIVRRAAIRAEFPLLDAALAKRASMMTVGNTGAIVPLEPATSFIASGTWNKPTVGRVVVIKPWLEGPK